MSERKTAEIKFRVAPSAKARWQEAAAAEDISLSQLIDNAVESHVWAKQNAKLDGLALVDNAIAQLETQGAGESGLAEFIRTNVAEAGELTAESLENAQRQVLDDTAKAVRVYPDSESFLKSLDDACDCKPWEFCTHKAEA